MIRSLFQDAGTSLPYLALAQGLLINILSGKMNPGQRLPPVREIADSNGVCVTTAQRALEVLQREGLIITHRTKGKLVTSDAVQIESWKNRYIMIQMDLFIEKLHTLGLQDHEIRDRFLERL